MKRSYRYASLVLVVAIAVLVLAACGGSVSVGSSPAGQSTGANGQNTYTNDQYGFSITPDAQLKKGDPTNSDGAGGSPVFQVIFADPNGAQSSSAYLDAQQVSVYKLTRSVKASEVPGLKSELTGMVDQLMSSLTDAQLVQKLTPVTVNGVPGFAIKYTFTDSGKALTMASVFLFKGEYEYQIASQAATEHWDALKGKFESGVQSFTVQ